MIELIKNGYARLVTDGLVLLAAWAEFLALLGVLAYLLLRPGERR